MMLIIILILVGAIIGAVVMGAREDSNRD